MIYPKPSAPPAETDLISGQPEYIQNPVNEPPPPYHVNKITVQTPPYLEPVSNAPGLTPLSLIPPGFTSVTFSYPNSTPPPSYQPNPPQPLPDQTITQIVTPPTTATTSGTPPTVAQPLPTHTVFQFLPKNWKRYFFMVVILFSFPVSIYFVFETFQLYEKINIQVQKKVGKTKIVLTQVYKFCLVFNGFYSLNTLCKIPSDRYIIKQNFYFCYAVWQIISALGLVYCNFVIYSETCLAYTIYLFILAFGAFLFAFDDPYK